MLNNGELLEEEFDLITYERDPETGKLRPNEEYLEDNIYAE